MRAGECFRELDGPIKGLALRRAFGDALAGGNVPVLVGDTTNLTVVADFHITHLRPQNGSKGRPS